MTISPAKADDERDTFSAGSAAIYAPVLACSRQPAPPLLGQASWSVGPNDAADDLHDDRDRQGPPARVVAAGMVATLDAALLAGLALLLGGASASSSTAPRVIQYDEARHD